MKKGITVLSLFDGISGGQTALKKLGIEVDKYYASEIDKYAIAVTQYNYPNTIQLGDVTKWREWDIDWGNVDMIIGGSPCQGLSSSGKGEGLLDYRSKLFFDWIDIRNHVIKENPDAIFLLENVIPKKREWEENMTDLVGFRPVKIDSSLVSAQSRKRLYWTNITDIEQPKDREIYLRDIIESGETDSMKSFCIDANYFKGGNLKQYFEKSRRQIVFDSPIQVGYIRQNHRGSRVYDTNGKSVTLTSSGGGWGMKTGLYVMNNPTGAAERVRYDNDGKSYIKTEIRDDEKSNAIIAGNKRKFLLAEPTVGRIIGRKLNSEGVRDDNNADLEYVQTFEPRVDRKSGTITTVQKDNAVSVPITFSRKQQLSGKYLDKSLPLESSNWMGLNRNQRQAAIAEMIESGEIAIRMLTPVECERLQTFPDNYTKFGDFDGKIKEISKSQRYKMLGNSWTVDVIVHIMSFIK